MTDSYPDLRFGPGPSTGFTPAGIAAFDNLRPAAVVRELIQNSLDAAREANVERAEVRFRLTRVRREEIPGISSYRQAFEKATVSQRNMIGGPLTGQAELVVRRIRNALEREEMDVLSVLDNGIGLDEQRMNALLSDGLSVKDANATGTYGNGHSTAIPASDLRYILYGGVTSDGRATGSGHAVVASHVEEGDPHLRAGDGFFIRGFRAGVGTLYDYATGGDVPRLISDQVDEIRSVAGHGTCVIIPAFNHFLEEQSLWEMVTHAASANFFVAIAERELKVEVVDARVEGTPHGRVLDEITLADELGKHRDQRRAAAFLSGRRAFEAHAAFISGKRHCIATSAGGIEISLLENSSGTTRVDLCRNGMWIADDRKIPGFYQRFTDRVPFHAVLSLKPESGDRLYDFVRIAEGPLHDSIAIKRLPRKQQTECRKALREIIDWIQNNTPAIASDPYLPPAYLTLDFGDEGGNGNGRARKVFFGTPVPIRRNPVRQLRLVPGSQNEEESTPERNRKRKVRTPSSPDRTRRRPALPTIFQAVSRPSGNSRRHILVECPSGCPDAELRLVVDEALDATCERPGQDAYTPAVLSNVTIDGRVARTGQLVLRDGGVVGVRLGDLAAGSSVEVGTDYRFTGDFQGLTNPSLRVEIFRTQDVDTQSKSQ